MRAPPERLPAAALAAFREALGAEHVCEEEAALARVERATFPTASRVPVILAPGDRAEVQAVMRIAHEHRIRIYPVSTGRNWGYGSSVPVEGGCAVLSLRRLDRIVEIDEELAYATIEPGVTFRKLHAALEERGSRRFLPRTGSSPDTSVVGNTLERGVGRGPGADRIERGCGLEVVLADGGLIHTGYGRFEGAKAAEVHAFGPGPGIHGLFSQSNLGVVTRMTVWLDTEPVSFQRFSFGIRDRRRLPGLVDALRELLLAGSSRVGFALYNDYRALAQAGRYPFDEVGDRTPLPEEQLARMRSGLLDLTWVGEGTIASSSFEQGRAERAWIAGAIGPHVDHFHYKEQPGRAGGATADNLESAYWRKRGPITQDPDPDRDGCGVRWCAPAVPMRGRDIARAAGIVEALWTAHGFEPAISIQCVSGRCAYVVAALLYDRAEEGADARATACHEEALRELGAAGFVPYRLGIDAMDALPTAIDDHARFVRSIKQAVDPHHILAPGRYEAGGGGKR